MAITTIVHAVPPLTDDWTLTVECPCLDIELGFPVILELPTKTHSPWNASITCNYENQELLRK